MNVKFENVWQQPVKPVQEVLRVWTDYFQMDAGEQQRRMDELVYVVRGADDQVIGISTAKQVFIKQFQNNFLAVRFMIIPGHRFPGLMSKLVMITRDYLEAKGGHLGVGLIALIENEEMKRALRAPVLPSGFVYAGNSAAGHHIRIYYFKGARIA